MIQKDWFKKITTDHLLSMRQARYCRYPKKEGDKDNGYDSGSWIGYNIDHVELRNELSKRPHRIRAKDRRKSK